MSGKPRSFKKGKEQKSSAEELVNVREAIELFNAAAANLLSVVNETIADLRRTREEVRAILDKLEVRLASSPVLDERNGAATLLQGVPDASKSEPLKPAVSIQ